MSLRVFQRHCTLLAIIMLSGIGCLAEQAAGDPQAPPAATASDSTSTSRPTIVNGKESAQADHVTWQGQQLQMKGDVQILSPQGAYSADSAQYSFVAHLGELVNAKGSFLPYHFIAKQLLLEAKNVRRIKQARLTTCNREVHPHYAVLVNELTWYPDNRFYAKHVTLEVAGHKIITLPGYSGRLPSNSTGTSVQPPFAIGDSSQDGVFVGLHHDQPLGPHTDLDMKAQIGTSGLWRGDLDLNQQLSLPRPFAGGEISLLANEHENVENCLLGTNISTAVLQNLMINRLPELQVRLNPISLPGPLHGFALGLGAAMGRYQELPTDVTAYRTQAWCLLHAPTLHVGPAAVLWAVRVSQRGLQRLCKYLPDHPGHHRRQNRG